MCAPPKKTQSKIRFPNKIYFDYLHDENISSFFTAPTNSEVICKSSGTNSIQTRILKLLKKDNSKQLVGIFNLFFQGFPSGFN